MLGHMIKRVLSRNKDIIVKSTHHSPSMDDLYFNAENGIKDLKKICYKAGPFNYIINCIGILNSSIVKKNPDSVFRANQVNNLFPHALCKFAKEISANIIQISTDGVFSNDSNICKEDKKPNSSDLYGKTKALGEVISPNYLNIRCSIIGPSPYIKKGIFSWVLSQDRGATINGFVDQTWCGITTLQFANLCQLLIMDNYFDLVSKESSIHHFCPNKKVSKFDLLKLLIFYFRPDLSINSTTSNHNSITRILETNYITIKQKINFDNPLNEAIIDLKNEIEC